MEDEATPPTPLALENAELVRAAARRLGMHLLEENEDVLGGIGLWYSWPPDHPQGAADRWSWVACMNSGAITCLIRGRAGEKESLDIRLSSLDADLAALDRALRTGES